jgi:hypothetical protein
MALDKTQVYGHGKSYSTGTQSASVTPQERGRAFRFVTGRREESVGCIPRDHVLLTETTADVGCRRGLEMCDRRAATGDRLYLKSTKPV